MLILRVYAKLLQHFVDGLLVAVYLGPVLLQNLLEGLLLRAHQVEILVRNGHLSIGARGTPLEDVQGFEIKDYDKTINLNSSQDEAQRPLTHTLDEIAIRVGEVKLKRIHHGPPVWIGFL